MVLQCFNSARKFVNAFLHAIRNKTGYGPALEVGQMTRTIQITFCWVKQVSSLFCTWSYSLRPSGLLNCVVPSVLVSNYYIVKPTWEQLATRCGLYSKGIGYIMICIFYNPSIQVYFHPSWSYPEASGSHPPWSYFVHETTASDHRGY